MTEPTIAPDALHRWVVDLWRAAGSDAREATLTADHLIGANLAGHDSHGVGMIPRYVASWLAGELQLNRRVEVASDAGNMLVLDARRGMGQAVTHEAMALAIGRAREHGVCVLGLRHAHHLGRVGHWAEQAAAAGLVSIHFVNALSKPNVAPHGGRRGRFNTNPFTVGLPLPGREPVVLDFATSAIAQGKARVAHARGATVPPGTLLDAAGEPTVDPAVLFPPPGEEQGALLTMAAHKGHGLAIVCELLGAALTGGETSRPPNLTMKHAVWNNMLAIVLDPARLHGADTFGAEVAGFVEWVRSSPLRPGTDAILMPGEPERIARRERAHAVPIDRGSLAALDHAAAQVARASGTALPPLSTLVRAG